MIPSRLLPAAALIALVPALLVAVVLAVVGLPIWLAIVLGLLVGLLAALLLARSASSRALRGLGAQLVDEAGEPRIYNLLDGLVFAQERRGGAGQLCLSGHYVCY